MPKKVRCIGGCGKLMNGGVPYCVDCKNLDLIAVNTSEDVAIVEWNKDKDILIQEFKCILNRILRENKPQEPG
jgi:hypothetical protein